MTLVYIAAAVIIAFALGIIVGFALFSCMVIHEYESKMFCPVCEQMRVHT